MSVIKCPRCDINFIREEDGYCPICKKEMKGEMPKDDPSEFCIECGEHPALPGEELCLECMKAQQLALENVENGEDDEKIVKVANDETDDIVEDEDLVVDEPLHDPDIPDTELKAIHLELGFDDEDEDETGDEDEFDGFYEENIYDKIHER